MFASLYLPSVCLSKVKSGPLHSSCSAAEAVCRKVVALANFLLWQRNGKNGEWKSRKKDVGMISFRAGARWRVFGRTEKCEK